MDKEQCMLNARILQAQGYTQMQIAEMLGVSDRTVRNYLKEWPAGRKKPLRHSKLDPYKPFIEDMLEKNPSYDGRTVLHCCHGGSNNPFWHSRDLQYRSSQSIYC